MFTCGRTAPTPLDDRVDFRRVDVTDRDAVALWIDTIPSIDVLINNAAMLGERAALVDASADLWLKTFDVNVHGVFWVMKSAIPKLNAGAVVVNVSSSVGRTGRATWGAYSASKCALEGMTDILSQELQDATVFSANPGGTATAMRAEAFPDEDPETLPTAEQIAAVMVGWIDNASDLNGAKLNCRDALERV